MLLSIQESEQNGTDRTKYANRLLKNFSSPADQNLDGWSGGSTFTPIQTVLFDISPDLPELVSMDDGLKRTFDENEYVRGNWEETIKEVGDGK